MSLLLCPLDYRTLHRLSQSYPRTRQNRRSPLQIRQGPQTKMIAEHRFFGFIINASLPPYLLMFLRNKTRLVVRILVSRIRCSTSFPSIFLPQHKIANNIFFLVGKLGEICSSSCIDITAQIIYITEKSVSTEDSHEREFLCRKGGFEMKRSISFFRTPAA